MVLGVSIKMETPWASPGEMADEKAMPLIATPCQQSLAVAAFNWYTNSNVLWKLS